MIHLLLYIIIIILLLALNLRSYDLHNCFICLRREIGNLIYFKSTILNNSQRFPSYFATSNFSVNISRNIMYSLGFLSNSPVFQFAFSILSVCRLLFPNAMF